MISTSTTKSVCIIFEMISTFCAELLCLFCWLHQIVIIIFYNPITILICWWLLISRFVIKIKVILILIFSLACSKFDIQFLISCTKSRTIVFLLCSVLFWIRLLWYIYRIEVFNCWNIDFSELSFEIIMFWLKFKWIFLLAHSLFLNQHFWSVIWKFLSIYITIIIQN